VSHGAALAAVAAAATLFGTAGVARGLGPEGITATFAAAWRAVIGGAALTAFAAWRGAAPWGGPSRPGWTLLGGVAVIGYQLAFFAAAERLGVGLAAVVTIGTGPAVAGAIDRLLFRRRIAPRWVVGVVVAVAGIVALTAGGDAATTPTGWGFAVLAGCCYPVYGLASQRLMSDRSALGAIATVFGAGAVITLPIAVLATLDVGDRVDAGPALLLALYLGLAATALAYGLWAIGLHRLSLSDTVAVTLAEPVSAVVLSALLLDEPIGWRAAASMLVIMAGVVVATTGPRAEPAAGPD